MKTKPDGLEWTLRDAAPERFGVGFAGRVLARVGEDALASTRDFTAALERNFIRTIPLVAAASLILGLYSWWGGRSAADSLLDAALRLPPVSIATAYTPEMLYGVTDGDN